MNSVVRYGAIAGLLPFLATTLAWYFNWLTLAPFLHYSALIVSFLAGVLWWSALSAEPTPEKTPSDPALRPQPGITLVVALAIPAVAWLAWFLPPAWQVLLLGALFLLTWVWEMLVLRRALRRRYLVLRTALTLVVVLIHAGVWATL